MANIVRRRVDDSLRQIDDEQSTNALPLRVHRSGELIVESQVSLGVEPMLRIEWRVGPQYWAAGFTLMAFRSRTGFCPEKHPDDLNQHGALFIETRRDDSHIERPEEGTVYFTFLLHKRILLGLAERMIVVRFSETIPSAKVGIGRIRDKIDLQTMLQRQQLGEIEHETNMNEAEVRRIRSRRQLKDALEPPKPKHGDPVRDAELEAIDAMVDDFFAKEQKLESVKGNPKFKALKPKVRKAIIEKISERLDPGELSARRERRS